MKNENNNILEQFPKSREDLPEEYNKIYIEHYKKNREGKTKATYLSSRMESWMHKKVASDVSRAKCDRPTLEIGAGTLNQLQYEKDILTYDIVEPFGELFEKSKLKKRIRKIYKDIDEVDEQQKYDRITSTATFEHIMDLPRVVAKAALLLSQNGHLRVAIPNEGTVLWSLGTLITGHEYKKKYNLDYRVLMKYEHVNTAQEIEDVLQCFFSDISCSVMGISRKIAFYRFYDCSKPKIEKVRQYLA